MLKWIVILVTIAAVAWWTLATDALPEQSEPDESLIYTVERQNVSVGAVESGQLQAVKSHDIRSIRGKIEWVIKEGSEVKQGDKVLVLEVQQYEDQIKTANEEIKKKSDELAFYIDSTETEENITQSWIEDAQIKYDQAKESLRKFKQIDSIKKSNELDKKIEDAEQKLLQARTTVDEKQDKLDESVFIEAAKREKLEQEYKNAQKSIDNTRKTLEAAINEKNLYKSRTYPQELLRFQRDLERAKLEVDKERGRAQQNMVNHHNKIAGIKKQIERQQKNLENATENLGKCEVTAPISGVVIYGDPKSGNQHWIRNNLKAGGQTWKNYTLMTIPDMSKFSVQVPISEHVRGRIAIDCKAQIEIPAIPGLQIEGKLVNISQLAKPRQPGNPASPKVYTGTVELIGHDSRMVSGMTARVELIGEVRENTIAVPVEAIFSEDGKFFCYVKEQDGFTRRDVSLGVMNAFVVEVSEGLQERDVVSLIDPADDVAAVLK